MSKWVVRFAEYLYSCDPDGKLWVENPQAAEQLTYEQATRRGLSFWGSRVCPSCEAIADYQRRQAIGFPAVGLFSTPLGRALSLHETGIKTKS